jgi:hypothetical protein
VRSREIPDIYEETLWSEVLADAEIGQYGAKGFGFSDLTGQPYRSSSQMYSNISPFVTQEEAVVSVMLVLPPQGAV